MKLIGTYEPLIPRTAKPYDDLPEFPILPETMCVTIDQDGECQEWRVRPIYNEFISGWEYNGRLCGNFIMNVDLEGTDPATTLRIV